MTSARPCWRTPHKIHGFPLQICANMADLWRKYKHFIVNIRDISDIPRTRSKSISRDTLFPFMFSTQKWVAWVVASMGSKSGTSRIHNVSWDCFWRRTFCPHPKNSLIMQCQPYHTILLQLHREATGMTDSILRANIHVGQSGYLIGKDKTILFWNPNPTKNNLNIKWTNRELHHCQFTHAQF